MTGLPEDPKTRPDVKEHVHRAMKDELGVGVLEGSYGLRITNWCSGERERSIVRPMCHDLRSRRELIKGVAGAATALAVTSGSALAGAKAAAKKTAAPEGPRHELKIGLASYSLRALTLDQTIAACKDADIKCLTVKDMHLPMAAAPEKLKADADKIRAAGITIMGAGVVTMKEKDESKIRRVFEYAKLCGIPLIVAAPTLEVLDIVESLIKEFGIPVAIHNHGPEDKVFPSPREILPTLAKRDPRFGICMDAGHTWRAGVDPVKCAEECGARLLDLHVKDFKELNQATGKGIGTEVGRGLVPIAALLKQLAKMKFAGQVGLEYELNEKAPIPGMRESLAYMRGVVAGLAI